MNLRVLGFLVAAAGSLVLRQGNSFVADGSRFTVANADYYVFDKPNPIDRHLLVTGSNVQIQSRDRGLTIKGNTIEASWAELGPKKTEIRSGKVDGMASIIMDGKMARQAALDKARASNKPAPPEPAEIKVMEMDSDTLTYAGTIEKGTVTIPGPWTLTQASEGIQEPKDKGKPRIHYIQNVDGSGSSGLMNVVQAKDGSLSQLATGHLDGPVHLKVVRIENEVGNTKTSKTTFSIIADHIEINLLTQPGTITAEGHVTLDTDESDFSSNFLVDRIVFTVDENLQMLGFKASGNPGTTKATPKEGTH